MKSRHSAKSEDYTLGEEYRQPLIVLSRNENREARIESHSRKAFYKCVISMSFHIMALENLTKKLRIPNQCSQPS